MVVGISQKLDCKEVNQGERCGQQVQPGEEEDLMHQKLQVLQSELGGRGGRLEAEKILGRKMWCKGGSKYGCC